MTLTVTNPRFNEPDTGGSQRFAKMNFLDLNVDVKRLILDHLSQADLLRICLTHPQLYQLARPILYSSIELPSGLCPKQSHPITSLLRTILSQPEVARYVRRLSFVTNYKRHINLLWSSAPDDKKARKFLIPPSDVEAATRFVKECEGNVPYRDFLDRGSPNSDHGCISRYTPVNAALC